jgi:hypothetical protein
MFGNDVSSSNRHELQARAVLNHITWQCLLLSQLTASHHFGNSW